MRNFNDLRGEQNMKWNTEQQLESLLCDVVGWHSRTGTKGEIEFPHKLKNKLLELDYFKEHGSHIHLHDAGEERNALTALYKSDKTDRTIVLMSHFYAVHTEEFGSLGDLALRPRELTEAFKERID